MKRSLCCAFCDQPPVRTVGVIGLCQRHSDLTNAIADDAKNHPKDPPRRPRKPGRRRSPAASEGDR